MPSKWIEIDSPNAPAAEIARQVLWLRMKYVQQMLPLAAHEFREDVEHVHQLRVGCRRAGAALQAFRPLMPGKSKKLRRWLKRIRRAAGPARDADVLLERIQEQYQGDPQLKYLVARLRRRRADAQRPLVELEEKSRRGKLKRSIERCLATLGQRDSEAKVISFAEFAKAALRDASRPMLALAGLDQPSLAQLHELRIAGKRLRYSIELFHGAFPRELRTDFYPLVEKLQGRLGRLNDHVTAQSLFQGWLANMPSDRRAAYLAQCVVREHETAEKLRGEFLQWWTSKRIALLESHLSALIEDIR